MSRTALPNSFEDKAMALSETPLQLPFCDGTAFLVSRNSFLDVEVHSGMDKASRRARSAPAECRYEDFVAEINEAKPFTRTLTDRTVSTDYRDLDSLVDTEFGRQTSQQSSFSFSEMQDSPTAGSDDTEELSLDHFQTVMIKNIPCRCSAGEVLRAVDSLGFAGTYDFFYLPMNRRHKQGIGYAFINFIQLGTAAQFKEAIWGYRFPGRKSTKQVEIAPAQLQGRDEVEAYFSHTQVVHTRYRPLMSA